MNSSSQLRSRGDAIIEVLGDMTFGSVRMLYEQAESILGTGSKIRQIDLALVENVDSSGLALLLEWQAAARRNNAGFSITHAPADLLSLAKLCEAQELLQLEGRS